MSKQAMLLVIISVMAPPPFNLFKEGGGGIFVCSEQVYVKVSSGCSVSQLLFLKNPTHWPLGQEPPKTLLFRVSFS